MHGGPREPDALDRWLRGNGAATLDAVLGDSAEVLAVIDREFVIRYLNFAVAGLRREDLVGGDAFAIIPPEFAATARESFTRVLETGTRASFEMLYPSPDGILVWQVRVSPIRQDGEVIGALTLNLDVTDERRGGVDRDRFFSLSLDMLIVATADGRLKRVNPAFGHALGFEPEELVGMPFASFLHPDDVEKTAEAFQGVLSGIPVTDFENRYCRRDGTPRVFSWRSTVDPVSGDVYAVARDITDQRTTEAQLRHSQKMEAVGQLAGGVAHDFNNLMQAVLANAELALASGAPTPRVAQHLQEIENAGQRAADLTKQLLAFSRRQPLRRVRLDLDSLVRGMMALLERLLPENIAIDVRSPAELASVSADRTQVEQVILNLCVNARDAMERGGRLTIELDDVTMDARDCELNPWARPGRFVRLSVTDTGIGMSADVRERAFEPFFTTKGHQRGTGLGLATVYGIVQQHGGLVYVYSEPGIGTTFKVYLPADDQSTPVPEAAQEDEVLSLRGSETILLAEDEAIVRSPVMQVLEGAGYRTVAASNGHEAVRLLRERLESIDLVILDVVMPELGGPEAWERMRSMRPDLRVLFLSGYADQRCRERLPPGAHVLEKPFPTQELLRRVRRTLDA